MWSCCDHDGCMIAHRWFDDKPSESEMHYYGWRTYNFTNFRGYVDSYNLKITLCDSIYIYSVILYIIDILSITLTDFI